LQLSITRWALQAQRQENLSGFKASHEWELEDLSSNIKLYPKNYQICNKKIFNVKGNL